MINAFYLIEKALSVLVNYFALPSFPLYAMIKDKSSDL